MQETAVVQPTKACKPDGVRALSYEPYPWEQLNALADEELAAAFLAGQQDALTVLFDRYHRLIYSIALRILRDSGEAEDVVQTVFLDVSRAMANFDPARGTLKVWLMQYAYHRSLHRKRHLQANRFYEWVELEGASADLRMTMSVDHALEQRQLASMWLGKLDADKRQILELLYCEGMTAEEIAAQLDRSVHAVRHDLYRALAYLRKAIAQQKAREEQRLREAMEGARGSNAQAI